MGLLEFRIFGQMLKGKTGMLVSDTIDYIDAEFDFRTDDWKGLSKWAHFSKGRETYSVNLIDDKITKDMHLNLSEGRWEVKLHGNDPDGTLRITTNPINFCVNYFGKMPNGAPLPEIPLTPAEQIDAKSQLALDTANAAFGNAGEAIAKSKEVFEAAERGDFNGKDGEKGNPGITPEIQIGNIETLPPEAEATVSIGGTAEKPILNFGIPKGDAGEDGIGIEDVETQMSAEDGGFNVLTIRLTDGRSFGWAIMNGHKGETGKAGNPGLVWAGEWTPEGDYRAIRDGQVSRDVVMYNGSAYVVAVNNPAPVMGIVPEGDSTGRWALLAAKGEKGEPGEKGKEKRTVAVDISGFETEGKIVETYSDGTSVEYSFEFDSEGNPTKITDSDGNETVLTW